MSAPHKRVPDLLARRPTAIVAGPRAAAGPSDGVPSPPPTGSSSSTLPVPLPSALAAGASSSASTTASAAMSAAATLATPPLSAAVGAVEQQLVAAAQQHVDALKRHWTAAQRAVADAERAHAAGAPAGVGASASTAADTKPGAPGAAALSPPSRAVGDLARVLDDCILPAAAIIPGTAAAAAASSPLASPTSPASQLWTQLTAYVHTQTDAIVSTRNELAALSAHSDRLSLVLTHPANGLYARLAQQRERNAANRAHLQRVDRLIEAATLLAAVADRALPAPGAATSALDAQIALCDHSPILRADHEALAAAVGTFAGALNVAAEQVLECERDLAAAHALLVPGAAADPAATASAGTHYQSLQRHVRGARSALVARAVEALRGLRSFGSTGVALPAVWTALSRLSAIDEANAALGKTLREEIWNPLFRLHALEAESLGLCPRFFGAVQSIFPDATPPLPASDVIASAKAALGRALWPELATQTIRDVLDAAMPHTRADLTSFTTAVDCLTRLEADLRRIGFLTADSQLMFSVYRRDIAIHFAAHYRKRALDAARTLLTARDPPEIWLANPLDHVFVAKGAAAAPLHDAKAALADSDAATDAAITEALRSVDGASRAFFEATPCRISVTARRFAGRITHAVTEALASHASKDGGASAHCTSALLGTARALVTLYMAVAPVFRAAELRDVAQLAALFHNDCNYLAHHLSRLHTLWRLTIGADAAPALTGLGLIDLAAPLKALGAKYFIAQVNNTKHALRDAILSSVPPVSTTSKLKAVAAVAAAKTSTVLQAVRSTAAGAPGVTGSATVTALVAAADSATIPAAAATGVGVDEHSDNTLTLDVSNVEEESRRTRSVNALTRALNILNRFSKQLGEVVHRERVLVRRLVGGSGGLLDRYVLRPLVRGVLAQRDISVQAGQRLHTLMDHLGSYDFHLPLGELTLGVSAWSRFLAVRHVIEPAQTLVGLTADFAASTGGKNGPLTALTSAELSALVSAIYDPTDNRKKLLTLFASTPR